MSAKVQGIVLNVLFKNILLFSAGNEFLRVIFTLAYMAEFGSSAGELFGNSSKGDICSFVLCDQCHRWCSPIWTSTHRKIYGKDCTKCCKIQGRLWNDRVVPCVTFPGKGIVVFLLGAKNRLVSVTSFECTFSQRKVRYLEVVVIQSQIQLRRLWTLTVARPYQLGKRENSVWQDLR